jgi:hypothetical protein
MNAKVTIAAAGAAVALGGLAGAATALPSFSTAPSARAGAPGTLQAQLTGISVGRHATFDRIVFRFSGGRPSARVRYVTRVIQDPSGRTVVLRGRSFLRIVLQPARAHTANGSGTTVPRTITPLFPSLRQLRLAGDFEGVVSFGAGLSRRAGFRVFTLTGPQRVVVDIAH